ncbi:MAG: type II secretion system protein [Myxococcales bacterium]|nr:type II secretion system protein [Myxococcales bacterium]MCB9525676.1 type II secretion system protein [Myxococcales bacterium]
MRRPQRGLTLVELLITVAIIGLIAVVLLMLLMPSDDRRCRLEAERLAAYLTQTRATSVMNDGPTRAAFDFAQQVITQEEARSGADITAFSFQKSPTVDPFTVRKPVKCTALLVPMVGESTSGEAWLVFNGRQTIGGVAVLELNDAVYSVVVPPNIEGEITVVRGKAQPLTGPAQPGLVRTPMGLLGALPELGLGDVPDNLAPSLADTVDVAPVPPLPPALNPDPPQGGGDDPVDDPPVDEPDDPIDDPPPLPDPIDDEPEDDPEEEPEEDEAECGPQKPCEGWQRTCLMAEKRCVFSPVGLSFRAINMQVQAPAQAAPLLNSVVAQAASRGLFNLIVKVDAPLFGDDVSQGFRGGLYQAVSTGGGFVQDSNLPSYARAYTNNNCSTHDYCLAAGPLEEDQSELRFFVHKDGPPVPNECNYYGLVVEAAVLLNVTGGADRQSTRATITVTGAITPRRAKEVVLDDGSGLNLKGYFEENGIPPNADVSPRDGVSESWQFQMQGEAQVVDLLSGQPNPGVVVPRCED